MYYHVIIESNEKVGKSKTNRKYFELDITESTDIIDSIIIPYLNKDELHFDGYFLKYSDIARIAIKETNRTSSELSKFENDHMSAGIIMFVTKEDVVEYDKHAKDVTKELFQKAKEKMSMPKNQNTNLKPTDFSKVFVVHGQDELAKIELARFIEQLDLEAIILHEQASLGMTIIEKIEHYSNVNFGIVLYTPCDLGAKKGEDKYKPRARQNVVFEHGYLIAKLKRHNVCALVKDEVEIPNDISGVVYIPMDNNKAWKLLVAKELKNAGYQIDLNKL